MQANEYKLFFSCCVDALLLGFTPNLQKLLHHIIPKFIIDQLRNPVQKTLKYFLLEPSLALLEGVLQIPGAILILAPLNHIGKIRQYLLMVIIDRIIF